MADEQTPTDPLADIIATHVPATFQRGGWAYLGCLGCDWGQDAEYSALDHAPHRAHLAAVVRASGTTGSEQVARRLEADYDAATPAPAPADDDREALADHWGPVFAHDVWRCGGCGHVVSTNRLAGHTPKVNAAWAAHVLAARGSSAPTTTTVTEHQRDPEGFCRACGRTWPCRTEDRVVSAAQAREAYEHAESLDMADGPLVWCTRFLDYLGIEVQ
jgi:hypothetical protein